jgi:hypothetical protein
VTSTGSEAKVVLNREITTVNDFVKTGCEVKREEQKSEILL